MGDMHAILNVALIRLKNESLKIILNVLFKFSLWCFYLYKCLESLQKEDITGFLVGQPWDFVHYDH